MNYLAIDYGSKRIGLAYSINGIIFTLPVINNDDQLINQINHIITDYSIDKIYVGLSEGEFAKSIQEFVSRISPMLKLPIETVEEAVSTIEAEELNKVYNLGHQHIDSVAAAVILRRVTN